MSFVSYKNKYVASLINFDKGVEYIKDKSGHLLQKYLITEKNLVPYNYCYLMHLTGYEIRIVNTNDS